MDDAFYKTVMLTDTKLIERSIPDVLGCIHEKESVLNIHISPKVSVSFQPP